MPLRECVLLLPSYELDGYPRKLDSEPAAKLLAGWVAMWHPRLLLASQALPRWHQVEHPPTDLDGLLLVLPGLAEEFAPATLAENVDQADCQLLKPSSNWRELQQVMLQRWCPSESSATQGDGQNAGQNSNVVEQLDTEFAALGYCYLQIQLMTRQLRYTSNLDQALFSEQALEAASAATSGDRERAEQMLQACFDSLGQERDHYYSLDVHLIDLTLVATTTLGKSFIRQLESEHPTSLLMSGELLRELASRNAEANQRLHQAVESRRACLIGGLARERPHPLMDRNSIARDLYRGRDAYAELDYSPPRVFGRMSFGLQPDTSSLVRRFGFEGILLTALQGGRYPEGSQAKVSWESSDGTFLSALSGAVLDAADPSSFVSLGWTIGEALDHQHVPTMMFAHWPGRYCDFFELLSIVAARTPALGRWKLADDYFADTDQPYHQERLTPSAFSYNWLVDAPSAMNQAGGPACTAGDWIEATKRFHRIQCRLRSLQNLANLAYQLENYRASKPASSPQNSVHPDNQPAEHALEPKPDESGAETVDVSDPVNLPAAETRPEPSGRAMPVAQWAAELEDLWRRGDSLLDDPAAASNAAWALRGDMERVAQQVLQRLAKQLCGAKALALHEPGNASSEPVAKPAASEQTSAGRLLINPYGGPLRELAAGDAMELFGDQQPWHYANGRAGEARVSLLDVPSFGFVAAKRDSASSRDSKGVPLADVGGMLKNEFLEVQIHPAQGHLQSLHVPAKRGNRFSLQVARRSRAANGQFVYSEMKADRVRMLTSSNVCGLVRAEGDLLEQGRSIGKFEVDYEVWRGNRIVEVTIRLSQLAAIEDDNPWRDAFVARLAWPTEAAILRTLNGGQRQAWSSGKAVAASLIEIDETDYKTHYLPRGLAFHRRTDLRFLETILASKGQTQVAHRIGIAVDLPQPAVAARRFMDRHYQVDLEAGPRPFESRHGWLATSNEKNVGVDLECPLQNEQGQVVGVRLSVVESEGKSTTADVRLFREVASAARVDYLGGKVGKLTTAADRLTIPLRANEQVNVDVLWQV